MDIGTRAKVLSVKFHPCKREHINPEDVEAIDADYRGSKYIDDNKVIGMAIRMMAEQDDRRGLLAVKGLRR